MRGEGGGGPAAVLPAAVTAAAAAVARPGPVKGAGADEGGAS